MVSVKQKLDLVIKNDNDKDGLGVRKDPTSFLPEELMSYEIKTKKKKKKKKKQEDPFKDINDKTPLSTPIETCLDIDPEVNIKVENIEVELDFKDGTKTISGPTQLPDTSNCTLLICGQLQSPPAKLLQFANNAGLMVEGPNDDSQEPAVKIEEESKEAVLLTFESIINSHSIFDQDQVDPGEDVLVMPEQNYVCQVCHLVFKTTITLKNHQKRKHKSFRSFKHICDHCGMSYDVKNSLVAHIKRKHAPGVKPDDNAERTCEICALVFKGINRLRMHMRRKHGSFKDTFKFACSDCGLTYDKFSSLAVHRKRKHLGNRKPVVNQWFRCPFCPKAFSKRETYARHVQRKHRVSEDDAAKVNEQNLEGCRNEQTGEITCKECPLVFSSINFLKLHMRRKHNALVNDFRLKCKICNLSYDKIESLKRHVRRKHNNYSHCEVCDKHFETREAYMNHSHAKIVKECHICGSIFASQGGLAKHLRCTHKLDSPKVAFCNICNKGFHDKRQLKPHLMKVHLKVSYTCKYCKKVFKARESYRRHILVKHPVTKHYVTQMQQCDKCPEKFPDELELCQHINLVHAEKLPHDNLPFVKVKIEDDANGFYKCTKCPEIYSNFEQMKSHFEQSHHFGPETQCQVCGEIMAGNKLKKHIKEKHSVVLQQCKYCEFKTLNKASMTQHVLRHKNATTMHCDFPGCKYNSYYDGAMQKHKLKHKELGVKLQCAKCPFQSMNKYILRYHEEAHMTGKKKYQCDECDYATILPANLVQHKYKHSTVKRFKCEVCPFATKYNTSLRFHVKKKHCDLPTFS